MTARPQEIVVYTSPMCAPCEQLKGYLRQLGVAFRVRDLLMDEDAQDRLDDARIRSTPALEVDGVIYAGGELTPDKVRKLLGM
ncbi:MAG: glutaredoxin family protein [Hyphomicrobiaceae bacterium]|nr:glutaredoxin family protein [Hyphomicrobiaceae bacterium]